MPGKKYHEIHTDQFAIELAATPPTTIAAFFTSAKAMETDPRPKAAVRLSGNEEFYRLRIGGDHQIVYDVNDAVLTITFLNIRPIHRLPGSIFSTVKLN